ncbi:hypothetical protein E4U02_04140 [Microbacterium paludicola]|uniref:Uncharacterized protein n=1 Tax=Microbacterium paludicola TaxID=300019 RepID=A0A4Y9FZ70_9MICO|nr:hypothetical protein [Microbacterium paludicola]MBF0815594.1 hypothetical protein [Microbacterium paludicola]TFU33852.1 hypothetical protein E4U02_04140 [Microbacterium paludicola]
MTYTKADERRMNELREEPLDDAHLEELIGLLLTGAIRRQLWLLFLDEDDRLSEAIMPTDDFPRDPHEPNIVDDLGPVTAAHLIAARMPLVLEAVGAAALVLVWEREGAADFEREELAWAAAMAEALRLQDVPLRAQFLLHDDGVRPLTLDDYAPVTAGRGGGPA